MKVLTVCMLLHLGRSQTTQQPPVHYASSFSSIYYTTYIYRPYNHMQSFPNVIYRRREMQAYIYSDTIYIYTMAMNSFNQLWKMCAELGGEADCHVGFFFFFFSNL